MGSQRSHALIEIPPIAGIEPACIAKYKFSASNYHAVNRVIMKPGQDHMLKIFFMILLTIDLPYTHHRPTILFLLVLRA